MLVSQHSYRDVLKLTSMKCQWFEFNALQAFVCCSNTWYNSDMEEKKCESCPETHQLCQCSKCKTSLCAHHALSHMSSNSHFSLSLPSQSLQCCLCSRSDVRALVLCEKQDEAVLICKKGCSITIQGTRYPDENARPVMEGETVNQWCFERKLGSIAQPPLRFLLKPLNKKPELPKPEVKSVPSPDSEPKDTLPKASLSPPPIIEKPQEYKPNSQAHSFAPLPPVLQSTQSEEESKAPSLSTPPEQPLRPIPEPPKKKQPPRSPEPPPLRESDPLPQTYAVVPDTFEDEDQYLTVFRDLLDLEVAEERKQMAHLTSQGSVHWYQDQKIVGETFIMHVDELSPGDDLKVTDMNGNSAIVTVHEVRLEQDCLSFKGSVANLYIDYDSQFFRNEGEEEVAPPDTPMYTIEFWESGSIKRMKEGLKQFHNGRGVVRQTADWILGLERPVVNESKIPIAKPEGVVINKYQEEAIQYALANELALIQGPPGTGKTSTAAVIVYNMWFKAQEQILVCAPSNIAVDQLSLNIEKFAGVKVLRIYGKSRINMGEMLPAAHLSLHKKVRFYLKEKYPDTKDSFLDETLQVEQILLRCKVSEDVDAIEQELIEEHHVICCTCAMSTTKKLGSRRFKYLLVDEAGFSAEPETLLPILKGCEHFVLVGDHMQLPPVVKSRVALQCRYGRSMFERLIDIGIEAKMLQLQYRMHPALSAFPSKEFYRGKLKDGIQAKDRVLEEVSDMWPSRAKPMLFYDLKGTEERYGQSHSYCNQDEVEMIEYLLYDLLQHYVQPTSIGIITPYDGQRKLLLEYIEEKGRCDIENVEIKNIDGFQGREKDIILISCVRSNADQEIGFLTEERRLNVAITRAKYGLIVVGNVSVLKAGKFWRGLIGEFSLNRCIRDGDTQLQEFRLA